MGSHPGLGRIPLLTDPKSAGSRDPSLRRRGLGEGNGGESRGMGRGGGGERESGGAVRGQGRDATVCAGVTVCVYVCAFVCVCVCVCRGVCVH